MADYCRSAACFKALISIFFIRPADCRVFRGLIVANAAAAISMQGNRSLPFWGCAHFYLGWSGASALAAGVSPRAVAEHDTIASKEKEP
jgi:hypothetical protein